MPASWQTESGHLTCNWSEIAQRSQYRAHWMQQATDAPSSYLPPLLDFASRSPFGGAFWFEPITTRGTSE
jgi:hypothetical protein